MKTPRNQQLLGGGRRSLRLELAEWVSAGSLQMIQTSISVNSLCSGPNPNPHPTPTQPQPYDCEKLTCSSHAPHDESLQGETLKRPLCLLWDPAAPAWMGCPAHRCNP